MMNAFWLLALMALGGSALAKETVVVTNAKVVTVDAAFSVTDALAVEEGRIVATGEGARRLAGGPGVQVIDLQGATVLPGLMDSHAHPVAAATYEFDHPVPEINDIAGLLTYIKGRAAVLPEGTLIPISQIFITRLKEQRYPTRAELDGVAPRHPVDFSTGPDSMLNSLALKLAGIGHGFQVPAGSAGVVELDASGEPTGLMHAFEPKIGAKSLMRKPDAAQKRELVKTLFADYNSVGFTTIGDRGADEGNIEVYEALRAAGELTVRLRLSHTFAAGSVWRTTEAGLNQILAHPLRKPDALLQIIGTKIWLDGGMLTGSALMLQPWGVSAIYGISDPAYKGVQRTPSVNLTKMVEKVAGAGLQFTAHSVGDGAVKLLLDTYEEVNRTEPIRAARPCVTHANFWAPESVGQAARLGVMADVQPIWFYLDGATLLKQFGQERMSRFQPLRALFDAGVVVGGGSDHMQKIGSLRSINPYNPWLGMWTAVSRRCRDLAEPLHPEGGLTREEALRMYTINNARILFLENETGSLEVGKRADFIVVDRDVLHCPLDELREVKVRETWLEGKKIWGVK